MAYLMYFLLFVYGVVGVGTMLYVLNIGRNKMATALLAGVFWPLFWITGIDEQNKRMTGSDRQFPR